MTLKKEGGDAGEKEVAKLIPCPNCQSDLMLLPPNYPMYDVQCTACSFRAQVKTNKCKPKKEIFGAGWEILNKVLKAGYMMPPLIVNFKWTDGNAKRQNILFYPFVPKKHIKKTYLRRKGKTIYPMFNYIRLNELPCLQLYNK